MCDDDRYRAVILLASEAGLSAGEIRGLQFSDVKAGQLTVRRALDKRTNEVVAPKHNKARFRYRRVSRRYWRSFHDVGCG